jgi:hypothetical protein
VINVVLFLISKGTIGSQLFIYLFIHDFLMENLWSSPEFLKVGSGHKFWNLLVVKEKTICVLNDEHEVG